MRLDPSKYSFQKEQDIPLPGNLDNYSSDNAFWTSPVVNGVECKMEVDTGAAYAVMSEKEFKRKCSSAVKGNDALFGRNRLRDIKLK